MLCYPEAILSDGVSAPIVDFRRRELSLYSASKRGHLSTQTVFPKDSHLLINSISILARQIFLVWVLAVRLLLGDFPTNMSCSWHPEFPFVVTVVLLSCVQLCVPMDCSPPGPSVHGIFQARILSAFPFPPPGDWTHGLLSSALQVDSLPAGTPIVPYLCPMPTPLDWSKSLSSEHPSRLFQDCSK